jgi:hypothetical protein
VDKPHFLGLYSRELDAAEIFDSGAFWLQAYRPRAPKLNFPEVVPPITIPVLRIIHRFSEDGVEPGFDHQLQGYDQQRLWEDLKVFRIRLQKQNELRTSEENLLHIRED